MAFLNPVLAIHASTRITAKCLAGCTVESQHLFWDELNKIAIPQWHLDVHTHKHVLVEQSHQAAQVLDSGPGRKQRSYADDRVVECSKTRKWYLHS